MGIEHIESCFPHFFFWLYCYKTDYQSSAITAMSQVQYVVQYIAGMFPHDQKGLKGTPDTAAPIILRVQTTFTRLHHLFSQNKIFTQV